MDLWGRAGKAFSLFFGGRGEGMVETGSYYITLAGLEPSYVD